MGVLGWVRRWGGWGGTAVRPPAPIQQAKLYSTTDKVPNDGRSAQKRRSAQRRSAQQRATYPPVTKHPTTTKYPAMTKCPTKDEVASNGQTIVFYHIAGPQKSSQNDPNKCGLDNFSGAEVGCIRNGFLRRLQLGKSVWGSYLAKHYKTCIELDFDRFGIVFTCTKFHRLA